MRADRPFCPADENHPHSLAAAMLAGILLRFGLQAFATLEGHLLLCGGMLAAWLLCKALYPRFAVVAALLVGGAIAVFSGDVVGTHISLAFVAPEYIAPQFTLRCCSASASPSSWSPWPRKTPRVRHHAGFRLPGARVAADCRYRGSGAAAVAFGVYSICIAAITAAICQSPEAHPDPQRRWLAAAAAGGFYLLAGLFGGSITSLMSALPTAWIQMLAGLALLGTLGGSLFQALNQENERDAAVVTFLVTASGVTLAGIGSAFWGWRSAGEFRPAVSAAPRVTARASGRWRFSPGC
jgi:benzoate membrane transport protein